LRNKLLVVLLLTTLSALLVASTAMLFYDLRTYRESLVNDIDSQTELLGSACAAALSFNDPDVAREGLEVLRFRRKITAAAVYNARGALFASYTRAGEEEHFPKLPGEDGVSIDGETLTSFRRIIENDEILGTAYIRAELDLRERLSSYLGIVTAVAFLSLCVAVLVSLWLQSVITKPILSIVEIARQVVSNRDYSLRARKVSDDDVGTLVDGFNEMLNAIERRTQELEKSNRDLEHQMAERQRAEQETRRLNAELESRVRDRTLQLERTNNELESFCYSVSHDLRGPLRAIDGFSQALREELPGDLNGDATRYFERIRAATSRMGQLIEDLLNLSRVSRSELHYGQVDLSALAEEIMKNLRSVDPSRSVEVSVWEGMKVDGDVRLLRAALENLLGNAWKFTSRKEHARIEVGSMRDGDKAVYFVRDNGAGFEMAYADKLFGAFQRLHSEREFPGTGIGLATVQRIIHRHGGRIWSDAAPGQGAVFYFTLAPERNPAPASQPN
jgi:signal transduction histidine kinase